MPLATNMVHRRGALPGSRVLLPVTKDTSAKALGREGKQRPSSCLPCGSQCALDLKWCQRGYEHCCWHAALLAGVPEDSCCFSRSFEDLTCFWEEEEEEAASRTCHFYYWYSRDVPTACKVSTWRHEASGTRHVCVFPGQDVRLFTQLHLHVLDATTNQTKYWRELSVEAVGDIGLCCSTRDLQRMRCEWSWDPAEPHGSHQLFYRPPPSGAGTSCKNIFMHVNAGKSGSKIQSTPTKAGADRYIPSRSTMQMEMASFLLTKENDLAEESPTKKEQQKAWAVNLNGFDIEEAKILRLCGKPQNAPEGYQNNLKVLYSQKTTPGSGRKNGRYIPSMPDRILDAPEIRNDYYLNLIDWSSQNFLAVALDSSVYLWNHASGEIIQLLQMEHPDDYVSAVSWIKEGNYLAVGTSNAEVQLWDIQHQKRLRNMTSHSSRVGSLSWNSYILSSGARTGHIHHHDVRVAEHHVATLAGHTQEVCGLKWSLDGRYLASGGNDNLVNVWPCTQGDSGDFAPVQTFTQHQGAVKAVAWCPWQSNVLATGGGTSDRHIRIWNVCSGTCLSVVDAHSQVCSILWSTNYKEFISGHGFAQNQLIIWKYPTMAKVTELRGHTARVLNLTMSPDGATVASAAADETLRLWRCFEMDPIKKKEKEKANSAKSSIIHQGIR
nr:PREDICTED: cell division cycle protein 20 homolog [Opisthocomus hoazin]